MGKVVGILIVTFNTWEETNACLTSLRSASLGDAVAYVIDNGSSDGTVERLKTIHGWPRYIETGNNLGYGGGNNIGIDLALADGCDAVLILNPDTRVAADFLAILTETLFLKPGCDAVGPVWRTLDGEQRLARNVAAWSPRRAEYVWSRAPERAVVKTEAISGCCMLLSREALMRVGKFDERFFMYWEEIDFCRRLNMANAKLLINSNSLIWHRVEGKSCTNMVVWKAYYYYRNWLLFLHKHGLLEGRIWVRALTHLGVSAVRVGAKDAPTGIKLLRNGLLGMRDFRCGRFGVCDQKAGLSSG